MSVKIYPVIKTAENCLDYRVFVNGQEVELNTARVSSQPYNRRWPGHQRQIDQTELVNFVSFAMERETEIVIIPKTLFSSVKIRPRRLNAETMVRADGVITVKLKQPSYFTVEPYGERCALHVFADPMPNYDVDKNDSNVLYFGEGEHDAGVIELKSNQTLFLDEGAVVYAAVFAVDAENVRILGRGILDNGKNKEKILFDASVENNSTACNNADREHAITLVGCKKVEIDGITIRDSLLYNIDNISCEDVRIRNVKIIGSWRFNSDGIHFANCINGSLTDCFIRTYDDAVCVRGYAQFEYDKWLKDKKEYLFECKNIRVKNCTIWNDWGKGMQIGTETYSSEISDIIFENCNVIRVSFGALYMWVVDCAKVRDILFHDIDVEFDEYNRAPTIQPMDDAIYTYQYDANFSAPFIAFSIEKHFEYSMTKKESEIGSIRDVRLKNIRFYALQKPTFVFAGFSDTSRCENISLEGIYWNGEPISQSLFESATSMNEYCFDIRLSNEAR